MDDWQLLSERPGQSRAGAIVTREYALPNGTRTEHDVHVGPDTVAVVAITTDRKVVLARQYRPGPGRVLDELPGGGIDEGESPAQAAARELLEETGYIGTIEVVGSTWLTGHATRHRWATVAVDCVLQQDPTPEHGELCEPVLMPIPVFRDHLRSGQLSDVDIGYLGLDHRGLL